MLGGILGFLPILGFWMFPLGASFIALEIPWTKKYVAKWVTKLSEKTPSDECGPIH